jgi:hypothetical protein
MHHEIHIDTALRRARVKTWGKASVEGFRHTVTAMVSHPDWKADMDVLVDHTRLEVADMDSESIWQLSKMAQELDRLTGRGWCAIVADKTLTFGLARMFQEMTESQIGQTLRIFETHDEANAWLDHRQNGRP